MFLMYFGRTSRPNLLLENQIRMSHERKLLALESKLEQRIEAATRDVALHAEGVCACPASVEGEEILCKGNRQDARIC